MKARENFYYIITKVFSFFPNVEGEYSIFDKNTKNFLKNYGYILLLLSWFILFFLNSVLSFIAGDFFPSNIQNVKNFLDDYPNLLNYTLICPLYIVFGSAFIVSSIKLRKDLYKNSLFDELNIKFDSKSHFYSMVFYFLLAFVFSIVVISFYGSELNKYNYVFWFQEGSSQIDRAHHIFYLIYNFILLIVILLSASLHFEMFYIAKRFGKSIRKLLVESKNSLDNLPAQLLRPQDIKSLFSGYISLYTISKILLFSVLINLYTWKAQDPDFIGMLDLTIIAYFILGVLIVSYPRYHIQFWIYKAWQLTKNDDYPDIRISKVQGLVGIFDVFILGTAIINLINYSIIKLGLSENIVELIRLLI